MQSSQNHDVFTVSQLNQRARQLLEISFSSVKVEGEISNLSRPASGHWYFTLKDAGAQVRCAMFRSRTTQLRFQPKEGDHIVVRGKVSLYENRGDYQLIVDAMKPAGEGALQQAFIQLKQKLGAEGLFAQEAKKTLPTHPSRVAVITSPTGAAVHDILTVLKRRFPAIEVDIYPVQVQGAEAAGQIIQAIHQAHNDQRADVIIVGRGGGSLEDLWCFNDENLARTIFHCPMPIISAVGHEVDFTIADFVADQRAATPSAAAELISPDQNHYLQAFQNIEQKLFNSIQQHLQQSQWRLQTASKGLQHPGDKLLQMNQRLDMLDIRLQQAQKQSLQQAQQKLQILSQKLQGQNPQGKLEQASQAVQQLQQRLMQSTHHLLEKKSEQLRTNMQLLHAVSPLNTLGRGYSILQTPDGGVVQDNEQVKAGEQLTARLNKGQLQLEVIDNKS